MKKYKSCLCFLAALLLLGSLTGCKKDVEEPVTSSQLSVVSRVESEQNDSSDTASDVEEASAVSSESASDLTDAMILTTATGLQVEAPAFLTEEQQGLFAEAYDAIWHLQVSIGYGTTVSESPIYLEGTDWYRSDQRFADMAVYQSYLDGLFTSAYKDTLGADVCYRDINGHLYASAGDRSSNIFYQNIQFCKAVQSEDSVSFVGRAYFSAKMVDPDSTTPDWTEDFTFTLTRTAAGWRFSQFSLWA